MCCFVLKVPAMNPACEGAYEAAQTMRMVSLEAQTLGASLAMIDLASWLGPSGAGARSRLEAAQVQALSVSEALRCALLAAQYEVSALEQAQGAALAGSHPLINRPALLEQVAFVAAQGAQGGRSGW